MQGIVDILERRVAAAVALIGTLREKTAALERELADAPVGASAAKHAAASGGAPPDRPCDQTAAELERLRAERAVVRERVRALIREIDRVSW